MNLNYQTRMVLFFSTLFVGMQIVTLVAIYWVSRENVINQIGQNLIYAENIFDRILTAQGEQMAGETQVLATDFGFRSVVTEPDQDTLNSALENLTYRIKAQRGFYINLQGNILADTAGTYQGKPFMFPDAISKAEQHGKSVVFDILDGEFMELTVAPILAPMPIGWVAIANRVDRGLVDSFRHLSAVPLEVTVLLMNADQRQLLISSLARPQIEQFQIPITEQAPPNLLKMGEQTFVTLARPLETARSNQSIFVVVQLDLDQALAPYAWLINAVSGLMVFGLLLTVWGIYLLAKNIAQPLRELAGASQRMLAGEANTQLPVTRNDELGRLAETFNTAGKIASEMLVLKEQDSQRREWVASVSHDLRTPLTSLHGFLETMQLQSTQLRESEQHYLAAAVKQSEKVGRLAQELFELAKLECQVTTATMEIFNLLELIQDVVQKYALVAQKRGVNLHADFEVTVPHVYADIAMIERVLTNLLDNAIRHTAKGGEVTITLHNQSGRVVVAIRDTGEGIAAEYLPKLFARDSPLSKQLKQGGGGLGLQIVAKMLALHEGQIQVESQLGIGSVFRFSLAVANSNA